MSPVPTSAFAFAVCQPGMERWLKQEVSKLRPDLRPAFQRPGLVTFKATEGPFRPTDVPATIFARAWGCSGGPARSVDEVLIVAQGTGARVAWVSPRDAGIPDEIPPALQVAVDADAQRWSLGVMGAGKFGNTPRRDEVVLDVITFPGEPALVGWHAHSLKHHQGPGGRYAYDVPAGLPSRTWRKVVEGLTWSNIAMRGQVVLELGASPGGGTQAFVEAGARVYAVDPRPLSPAVLALPGVRYVERHVGDIALNELPSETTWLACDTAAPPADEWGAMRRLLPALPALRGVFWLVKLVDDSTIRGLPRLLRELSQAGFNHVNARQLPANRRDLCVVATRG